MFGTLFSILRLWLGCFGLLLGISWAFGPVPSVPWVWQTDLSTLRILGLAIGSAGLAMTLQEVAYIHSRFMRGTEK